MLKFKVTFELDEERLRDFFDSNDIKFSKNKVKELKSNLIEVESDVLIELEEKFDEIIDEMIMELFEK
jgi:hypothetical protein